MFSSSDDIPILTVDGIVLDAGESRDEYWPVDRFQLFQSSMGTDCQFTAQVSEEDDPPVKGKLFKAPLWVVAQRLDWLGVTLESIRRTENYFRRDSHGERGLRDDFRLPRKVEFELIEESFTRFKIDETVSGDYLTPKNQFVQDVANLAARLQILPDEVPHANNVVKWFEAGIKDLDPLVILKLLSCNPLNKNCVVTWAAISEDFFDIADDDLFETDFGAKPENQFMFVTEGKSDSRILKRAIELLTPEFADFFTFVDMESDYPITGVGNLLNFYKGLVKLGVLNQIIVIFDNDLAGSRGLESAQKLQSLQNIRITKLPDLVDLENFQTIGPTGESISNINGRASSIECFLDLSWETNKTPTVRWKSYIDAADEYQGELVDKAAYQRRFEKLPLAQVTEYNSDKLLILLDHLFEIAAEISTAKEMRGFHD